MKKRMLDLFAGIGGFSLAGEAMGWETAAFVEWDNYCKKVLKKNYSNTPIYGDIRKFKYEKEKQKIGPIDIICGGFPCQPFSTAGKRKGTKDDRYLWPEMLRVIREVKPAWVVGENVPGIISMDGGKVLEKICLDLESEGYAVQPFIIPALAVGAWHRRNRIWIIAHNEGERFNEKRENINRPTQRIAGGDMQPLTNTNSIKRGQRERGAECKTQNDGPDNSRINSNIISQQNIRQHKEGLFNQSAGSNQTNTNIDSQGLPEYVRGQLKSFSEKNESPQGCKHCGISSARKWWEIGWTKVATWLCRSHDGLSPWVHRHRTNRLKALGNSVVPQVVYEIFKIIEEYEKEMKKN
jgi:DNA (cytosine-5)-methyltransferase 1